MSDSSFHLDPVEHARIILETVGGDKAFAVELTDRNMRHCPPGSRRYFALVHESMCRLVGVSVPSANEWDEA